MCTGEEMVERVCVCVRMCVCACVHTRASMLTYMYMCMCNCLRHRIVVPGCVCIKDWITFLSAVNWEWYAS